MVLPAEPAMQPISGSGSTTGNIISIYVQNSNQSFLYEVSAICPIKCEPKADVLEQPRLNHIFSAVKAWATKERAVPGGDSLY